MQLIVFGIEQMDPGFDVMKPENLLLKRDELIAFFGIAGNGKTSDREFKAPQGLNGGSNHGIVSENLFSLIGIGRLASNTYSGRLIIGKPGTTESKSIGIIINQG